MATTPSRTTPTKTKSTPALPPPPSAPPMTLPKDRDSLFSSLDNALRAFAEEDAGLLPSDLQAGPCVQVSSIGKKRRRTIPPQVHPDITTTTSTTLPLPPVLVRPSQPSLTEPTLLVHEQVKETTLHHHSSNHYSDDASSSSFSSLPATAAQKPTLVREETPPKDRNPLPSPAPERTSASRTRSSSGRIMSPPLPPALAASLEPTPPPSSLSSSMELDGEIFHPTTTALPDPGAFLDSMATLSALVTPAISTESTGKSGSPSPTTATKKHANEEDPAASAAPTPPPKKGRRNPDKELLADFENLVERERRLSSVAAAASTPDGTALKKKGKKEKAPEITSVASKIGSRRKPVMAPSPVQPSDNHSHHGSSPSSGSTSRRSNSRTITRIRSNSPTRADCQLRTKQTLPGEVIDLDGDDDKDQIADQGKGKSLKDQPLMPPPPPPPPSSSSTSRAAPSASSSSSTRSSVRRTTSGSSTSQSHGSGRRGIFVGMCIYVVPHNITSTRYGMLRTHVLKQGGKWAGPEVRKLDWDGTPLGMVPLDQEKVTHIVTDLTTTAGLFAALKVEHINKKIPIVNTEWMSDSLMFNKLMPLKSRYDIARTKAPTLIREPSSQTTPPPAGVSTPPRSSLNASLGGDGAGGVGGSSNAHAKETRFAIFESTEDGQQVQFNDIVLGLQDGSLDDSQLSDPEELDEDEGAGGEEGKGDGGDAGPSTATNVTTLQGEAEDTTGYPGADNTQSPPTFVPRPSPLTNEDQERLRQENRCFYCRELGHWVNKCPVKKADERVQDKDQVLLQIINSGKALVQGAEGSPSGRKKILYQCQSPHVDGKKKEPPFNKQIIEQLTVMMNHYDKIKTKDSTDNFRVINYRKAITAIRALDYEITSEEMAAKVPRVGKNIAQKIGQCISLGRIQKLDYLNWDSERSKVEGLFRGIYGVGSEKAQEWFNRGLRTLDDVRALSDLTANQKAGLKYYDDLLVRIPRDKVEKIGKVVEQSAKNFHPDIQSQVTGSYRRGKADCGDVDIVIARPHIDTGGELYPIMKHILDDLSLQGFLVEHLSLPTWEDGMEDQLKHFKYMGICKLPGEGHVHHHIDILVVPWMHLGAVLLYFTGNDICNRSMRLLASNRGMRLSDKGLFAGVMRGKKRKRINEGHWVAGRTEREVFEYLKIRYLEPFEREC